MDGQSGLVAARSAQPVMIFLDLNLPDSTGEDVLAASGAIRALKTVPVAVVTSRSLSAEERSRLGERAQAVLEEERAERRSRTRDSDSRRMGCRMRA